MQIPNKKNDSDCTFENFSLLVPYPKDFLVVCICILISMVYTPITTKSFLRRLIFFSYLVARGWENLKCLGDLLY